MSLVHIDAGHGDWDPGAQSQGFVEKVLNLEASLYQERRFKELGIDVSMTRRNDTGYSSVTRTRKVKQSGAKICISNHFNADMGRAQGCETIHSIYSSGRYGKLIADELVKVGQPLRRVFSRKNRSGSDYYYMHRLTGNVEVVIVEYAFLDNRQDGVRIRSKEYREKLYEGVVKATCAYLNKRYVGPDGRKSHVSSKPKSESNQIQTVVTLIKDGYANYKLVSKVDDLRFYDNPSWEDTDLVGRMDKGYHFPIVLGKYKVDGHEQYKVQNSKGQTFYITAAEKFVELIDKGAEQMAINKENTGFVDVEEGVYYADAVKFLAEEGILSGIGNDEFGSDDALRRKDFAIALYRYAKAEDDISYEVAIDWVKEQGIMSGYPSGDFGGNDPLRRKDFAVALYRYAKSK